MAKEMFPNAKVTILAVRIWVKECHVCQKMRNTGIKGLPEQF
jgi:hypothetical protein